MIRNYLLSNLGFGAEGDARDLKILKPVNGVLLFRVPVRVSLPLWFSVELFRFSPWPLSISVVALFCAPRAAVFLFILDCLPARTSCPRFISFSLSSSSSPFSSSLLSFSSYHAVSLTDYHYCGQGCIAAHGLAPSPASSFSLYFSVPSFRNGLVVAPLLLLLACSLLSYFAFLFCFCLYPRLAALHCVEGFLYSHVVRGREGRRR